jgi:hypothetical protein
MLVSYGINVVKKMSKVNKNAIFSTRKKREYRMFGMSITQETFEFLSLYVLITKGTKSKYILPLVYDWIRDRREEGYTESEMILSIINTVKEKWGYIKINKKKPNLEVFKDNLAKELTKKGISKKTIAVILKAIKE